MGFNHDDQDGSRHLKRNRLTVLIAVVLLILCEAVSRGDGYYIAEVQWTVEAPVTQYTSYQDVSLITITIPQETEEVFWTFRAFASDEKCTVRKVKVYLQRGRYPVISPNNETFPDHFHLHQRQAQEYVVPSSNTSVEATLPYPMPGKWYAGAIMKEYSSDEIRQRGLTKDCTYSLSVITVTKVLEDVWDLSMEKSHKIHLNHDRERIYKYRAPDFTVFYDIQISGCETTEGNTTQAISPCPFSFMVSDEVVPSNTSVTINCSITNKTCIYPVTSPPIVEPTYIKFIRNPALPLVKALSFNLHFLTYECDKPTLLVDMGKKNTTDGIVRYSPYRQERPTKKAHCVTSNSLGRYKIAPFDFSGVFVIHNYGELPIPENQILLSSQWSFSTSFNLDDVEDIGGTLKINLGVLEDRAHLREGYKIWLCLMKGRVPYKDTLLECPDAALMTVNTTSEESSFAKLYIPYPEAGQWYLSLQTACYNISDPHKPLVCDHAPLVEFMVSLSPCVEEGCGRFGKCKEYISGVHIFSSCECYAGWQGYGCTDGSHANSDTKELAMTLLLTLSNLFFIPGILLALRRRYFVEALVYFFNMFFSTFYHACDSSKIYILCIMKYDTLSYADFMGSIMSFWMTLMAMSRLHPQLRSLLHMFGVLSISVMMDFDRHGLWESVVPIGGGVLILLISWAKVWCQRRTCFPSKWRYIKFLLPGFLLAVTGLVIFSFFETQENYMYTHSVWHMVMSLSIIFLLPPRRLKAKVHSTRKWCQVWRLVCTLKSFLSQGILILTLRIIDSGHA
ncbi:post-GPI attachment to proteins factor 6-like isoform X2 [Haliotis asinina]|uniref:post-GPI attachment to proteins factor 6-like isoform X2 n=1 Tax=Haliotis asinina TaxID=109174 RepID=UPI0035319A26